MAYFKVAAARSGFPAPTFWAPKADTVDNMEDGTKNRKLITFSTIPTAAASVRPLLFAIIVIMINATWIRPSCIAIGKPIFNSLPMVSFLGLKSLFFTVIPVFPFINMVRATMAISNQNGVSGEDLNGLIEKIISSLSGIKDADANSAKVQDGSKY